MVDKTTTTTTGGFIKTRKQVAKLGDLLIGADILSETQLQHALQVANQTLQPVGRVLVDLKYLEQSDIDGAATLQVMLLENQLPVATAVRALGRAHRSKVTLDEALQAIGWVPLQVKEESEIGLFLVDASIITRAIYEDILQKSAQEKCQFGTYLVIKKLLSYNLLNSCLQAMVLVSQEKLSRLEAVAVARHVFVSGTSFWQALTEAGLDERTVSGGKLSLGEILTQSGFITEVDRVALVERSLAEQKLLGELLVDAGLISRQVLESALILQGMAKSGAIAGKEASDLLKETGKSGCDLKMQLEKRYAVQEKDMAERAVQLLTDARLVGPNDLQLGGAKALAYSVDILRGLVIAGCLERHVFDAAKDLVGLIDRGEVSREQAILLFNYCDRGRLSLADARDAMSGKSKIAIPEDSSSSDTTSKANRITLSQNRAKLKPEPNIESLDEDTRKLFGPELVNAVLRSVVIFACISGLAYQFLPKFQFIHIEQMHIIYICLGLWLVDLIRIVISTELKRRKIYEIRSIDIEGSQEKFSKSSNKNFK